MDADLQELLQSDYSAQDLMHLAQLLRMQSQTQMQGENTMQSVETVPQQPSSSVFHEQTDQGLPVYFQTQQMACEHSPRQSSAVPVPAPAQQAYQLSPGQFFINPRNQTTAEVIPVQATFTGLNQQNYQPFLDQTMHLGNQTHEGLSQQVGFAPPQLVYQPLPEQPNQQTGEAQPQQSTLPMLSHQSGTVQETHLQGFNQTAHVVSAAQGVQLVYYEALPQQAVTGDSILLDDIMEMISKNDNELDQSSPDSLLRKFDGAPSHLDGPSQVTDARLVTTPNMTTMQSSQATPSSGATNTIATAPATNHVGSPEGHIAAQDLLTNPGGSFPTPAEQHMVIPPHDPSVMTNRSGEPIPPNIPVETKVSKHKNTTKLTPSSNNGKTNGAVNRVSSTSGTNTEQGAAVVKKKKSKRQRKKKSADQSGPPSSFEIDAKRAKTATEESTVLPEDQRLQIRLFYQSHEVKGDQCGGPESCLLFHKKPWKFGDGDTNIKYLEFPELLDGNSQMPVMTAKQTEATITVLNALGKGIRIDCDKKDNIVATRFCQSHVYCYSTVPGPEFEPVISPTGNPFAKKSHKLFFRKLPSGGKVKVFDFKKYSGILSKELQEKWARDAQENPCNATEHNTDSWVRPSVYFTFGQSWEAGFPLSNCLVYAKIKPLKAWEYQKTLMHKENDSFPCDDIEIQMSTLSLNSGNGGSFQKQ